MHWFVKTLFITFSLIFHTEHFGIKLYVSYIAKMKIFTNSYFVNWQAFTDRISRKILFSKCALHEIENSVIHPKLSGVSSGKRERHISEFTVTQPTSQRRYRHNIHLQTNLFLIDRNRGCCTWTVLPIQTQPHEQLILKGK